jgi:hypothetical protein
MTPNELIGLGEVCCPSCKSDNWKSSKLIVLENVSNIEGTISGEISEPGILSGNTRAFFLSDRWFTFSKDVDLDVKLSCSNGLVDEVKRLMLSYSMITEMPEPPDPLGFFEKINPIEPKKPILVNPILPIDKKWYVHFIESSITWAGLLSLIAITINFFSSSFNIAFYLYTLLIIIPICFILSFSANSRAKSLYSEQVKNFPQTKEKYIKDLQKYEIDFYKYLAECKQQELQNEDEKKKQSQYEEAKQNAIKIRELLWQRSRVCMRCGTAYIGRI